MQPLLHNKYVRYVALGIAGLLALFVVLIIVGLITSTLSSTGRSQSGTFLGAPSINKDMVYGDTASNSYDSGMVSSESSEVYYPTIAPTPIPEGYTSGLESYETTTYNITGRTRQLDMFCSTLVALKVDPTIHFKNITTNTNSCNATFYTTEEAAPAVLSSLGSFKGIEFNRNTISVTRHKQRLESQTQILQQQLARIENALSAAQAQYDRLNGLFNTSDEVTRLSAEVTKSLQYIDTLTRQKISTISQLDDLYQQAADLQERLEVIGFNVSVSRLNPIYPNQTEQKWSRAWNDVKDEFTNTLIGITATFGIFLMRAIQLILYLLVGIVILRGLWKFGKLLWSKW